MKRLITWMIFLSALYSGGCFVAKSGVAEIFEPSATMSPQPTQTKAPVPSAPADTAAGDPLASAEPSTAPDPDSQWADYDLAAALRDNRAYLDMYVDTPVNLLIKLFGFDGIVSQIKDMASENIILTDACIPLAEAITDIDVAAAYHQSFVSVNAQMAACNERTLEVKQSRDIGAFEGALNDTVDVLEAYQALLESFKAAVGG